MFLKIKDMKTAFKIWYAVEFESISETRGKPAPSMLYVGLWTLPQQRIRDCKKLTNYFII